jgi:histidyl-tRNA synthetase
LKAVKALREAGITSELYPDAAKMKKQMSHADKRNIQFVVLAGTQEMEEGVYTLKNMKTGDQTRVDLEGLKAALA